MDGIENGLKTFSVADPAVVECPYAAYAELREAAPVFFDPIGKFYILTRYADVRAALLAPETYICDDWMELIRSGIQLERARRANDRFAQQGWVPGLSIGMLPAERHGKVRAVFDKAFRGSRIQELDDFIKDTADRLIDGFVHAGKADLVAQFGVPFALQIITRLVGIPVEDIPRVKAWTDAWINRLGMMLSEAEEDEAVGMEIEFQHYTKKIIDRLRAAPDGSVLSDIINVPRPDGTFIDDAELFTHVNADLIVAGSETTTNAISSGIMLLCQNRPVLEKIRAEPDTYLRPFIEEVLRLEGPVQGLFRIAGRDIHLHGQTIPKGALIQLRYGAANRDPSQFGEPDLLDVERRNAATHLGFGGGAHRCVGAPLARAELYWGFKALIERLENIELAPENDFAHMQSVIHRSLKALHVTFTPK